MTNLTLWRIILHNEWHFNWVWQFWHLQLFFILMFLQDKDDME
jgi:hypothetical protein